jgi:hypothetical protein
MRPPIFIRYFHRDVPGIVFPNLEPFQPMPLVVTSKRTGRMTEYKVYRIRKDEAAEAPVVFEAESEAAAIERARQLVDGCDVELWQGPRFVMGLKGTSK